MHLNTVKYLMKNPGALVFMLGSRELLNWLPDKMYLQLLAKHSLGHKVDFEHPRTFSEKLQWLKLYDRKPLYTQLVDKFAVREYVAEKVGEEYLIPLVGGPWNSVDEIDFAALPEQFVLKTTHDSGGVVICRDKENFDVESAKSMLSKRLGQNFFWAGREWPYKDVQPRIIAERYMEDVRDAELRDYKFFSFNGKVRLMFIATERYTSGVETRFDFFDDNFEHLDFRNGHPNAEQLPRKPEQFEKMKALAEKLSEGIPQVRVDFYEVDGKIYFGEITFFHWGGLVPFDPPEWDEILGGWIELPEKTV